MIKERQADIVGALASDLHKVLASPGRRQNTIGAVVGRGTVASSYRDIVPSTLHSTVLRSQNTAS
jgi:hypothetical protein